MTDWPTIASLATAGGTLVLAAATFASVRSANRAARVAEQALLVNLRPLLLASRPQDPVEKVLWIDSHMSKLPGGHAVLESANGVVYLAASVRNAGQGIAVLHSWSIHTGRLDSTRPPDDPATFRRLTRDLYVPPGDIGYWQGAIRADDDPMRGPLEQAILDRTDVTVDVMYGDAEGGQRIITRFVFTPMGEGWWSSTSRHWFLDHAAPR